MRAIWFANAGNITAKESALHALTDWANSCERSLLLGRSSGTVLPRERHREWARQRLVGAEYLVRRTPRGHVQGFILRPRAA